MTEKQSPIQYDLEERTFQFAKQVREFVKKLPRTIVNLEDSRQLVNSSSSVGANYREANEALSKKDFVMRIKICRKEAKESRYWLRLVDVGQNGDIENERGYLENEAVQLTHIFGSIIVKSE